MQKSILGRLFNGELYPAEQAKPDEEEYTKASLNMGEWKEKLYSSLTQDQQHCFEKMAACYYIVTDKEHTAIFEEGFKLGVKIMLEVMETSDIPLQGISVILKSK